MTSVIDVPLQVIDAHAEGEAGRIIVNGGHFVRGDTMADRLEYCRQNLDGLRNLVLTEPRGNPALCAVLVLPPVTEGAHFGIVVLEQGGFTPMSGSNTICTVTALIEQGVIPSEAPVTEVRIDTAAGLVVAEARVQDGKVLNVTVNNVPSFVVELDRVLDVPSIGQVKVDIAFGGQFFVQVAASELGIELDANLGKELTRLGALLKLAAREQVVVQHPLAPEINDINLVMIHSGSPEPGKLNQNTVVLSNGPLIAEDESTWTGALDRSPCGTGTSARMAILHARGELAVGEEFVHHSIIGSTFIGKLVGTTSVAENDAVLPTITGRAWVSGVGTVFLDPMDPFPAGFTVTDIWAPRPAAK